VVAALRLPAIRPWRAVPTTVRARAVPAAAPMIAAAITDVRPRLLRPWDTGAHLLAGRLTPRKPSAGRRVAARRRSGSGRGVGAPLLAQIRVPYWGRTTPGRRSSVG